jgi:CTP synthase
MVERSKHTTSSVTIGIIGKYTDLHDAYLSVVESLKHAAIFNSTELKIIWIDSEEITEKNAGVLLSSLDGIIIPGGFGARGIEGKINATRYARENKIPYFGLALGMQIAVIEFARNIANLKNANSREMSLNTPYPVVDFLPGQNENSMPGSSLRLGQYPCRLTKGTKAFECYNTEVIAERHRNRYEVNNDYREQLVEKGLIISGVSPSGSFVQIIELQNHPWFVGCQCHPEFKSRPNRPHPLFMGFVKAAIKNLK